MLKKIRQFYKKPAVSSFEVEYKVTNEDGSLISCENFVVSVAGGSDVLRSHLFAHIKNLLIQVPMPGIGFTCRRSSGLTKEKINGLH